MKSDYWVVSHRPCELDQVVLPPRLRRNFERYLRQGSIPGLLLGGPRGVGKTTVAKILVRKLAVRERWLNTSDERGIDVVRDKIKRFADVYHRADGHRIIVLDEADGMTPEAQHSLDGLIEETSQFTRFILTANDVDEKIIDQLKSRLQWWKMRPVPESQRARTLARVLDAEGIEYEQAHVEWLAAESPDMRVVLHKAESRLDVTGTRLLPPENEVSETVLDTVRAVAELSDGSEGVSQGQLRDHLNLGRAAVSNRVSEAGAEGFVENRNPGPGTADALVLTDRGREVSNGTTEANDPGKSP